MLKKVPGFGPKDAKIVIVGEAPGADEERLGQPFIGISGNLLRDMMMQVGINPTQVYYTNICKYRPPGNDIRQFFDNNGKPNDLVIEGLAELKEELETIRPNVIITAGNYPTKMLTRKGRWTKDYGYSGITDYRGSILEVLNLLPGAKAVPIIHPAAILRQWPMKHITKLDLMRAEQQSHFPEIRRPQKQIIIDPRGEDRRAWGDWLLKDPKATIAFDIEYINNDLLCVGMTTHEDTAVVIHTINKADIRFVQDILESGIGLCAQNAMFDCSILDWHYNFNIMGKLVYDTMIAAHAAYIEYPKGLDFLTSVYTEQPFYKDMVDWKRVKTGDQPISEVLEYNAIDTWVTHAIMEAQKKHELTDPNVMKTFQHEMDLINPLWQVSKLGVKIDTKKLGELGETLKTESSLFLQGIRHITGTSVNVKSGPQVAKLLHEQLGLPILRKTPKGAAKTDDDTLAALSLQIKEEKPLKVIKLIRGARERLDLISKFVEIERDDDGRMRCHYDPAKTETGRLSSKKFFPTGRGSNLQNIPRDGRVRSVFVPDDGKLFGYADLMQAESLVVAHISRDPEMLRLHHTAGLDGHKYVASYLFDKPIESITKDERYVGKRIRHACNYAMGWKRLMDVINADAQKTGVSITAAQAKVYVEKYRQLHNFLPVWWREIQRELYESSTLYTLHGRKRVFYDRLDAILPIAIAYVPQGTVGDTLNIGLMRCMADEELRELDFQVLLQVHDAIGYQFPEANAFRVNQRVRELLAVELTVARFDEKFTIPVEIQVGENWGERTYPNPEHPEKNYNPGGLIMWDDDLKTA